MVVGILQVRLAIDGATSLKDKRRVVRSLKDKLHRDFQVSVAEVDSLDEHRTATLGITMAANSARHCHSVLDSVLNRLRDARDCYLADHTKEIIAGS